MTDQTTATKTMAHLQTATERWNAYQAAVAQHATRAVGRREQTDRTEQHSTEWYRNQEKAKGA
jgi:hypothetical protein